MTLEPVVGTTEGDMPTYKPGTLMHLDKKYAQNWFGVYELIISHVARDMYAAVLLGSKDNRIESGPGGWKFSEVRSPITDIFCV